MYQDSEAKSSQYPPPPSYSDPPPPSYSGPPLPSYSGSPSGQFSEPPPAQYNAPPTAQPPPPGVAYQGGTVVIKGPSGIAVYTAPPVNFKARRTTPGQYTCPSCQQVIMTRMEKKLSMGTHFCALALFVSVFCAACMWIPYCVDSGKNIDHYCPNCNAFIGTNIAFDDHSN